MSVALTMPTRRDHGGMNFQQALDLNEQTRRTHALLAQELLEKHPDQEVWKLLTQKFYGKKRIFGRSWPWVDNRRVDLASRLAFCAINDARRGRLD